MLVDKSANRGILVTLPTRLFPTLQRTLDDLLRFDSGALPIQRTSYYWQDKYPDHTLKEVDHLEDVNSRNFPAMPEPTLADFIVPRLLAHGDYVGDTLHASNARVFLRDHGDHPGVYRGTSGYGYEYIAIALWALVERDIDCYEWRDAYAADGAYIGTREPVYKSFPSAIADTLAQLNLSPILDEEDMSNLESDLRDEHINDPHGLPYEVIRTLRDNYGDEAAITLYYESLSNAQQSDHIYAALDRELDNGDAFLFQTHNSAYYRSEKLPALADNIAHHIYTTLAPQRRHAIATRYKHVIDYAWHPTRHPNPVWVECLTRLGRAYAMYWRLEAEYNMYPISN